MRRALLSAVCLLALVALGPATAQIGPGGGGAGATGANPNTFAMVGTSREQQNTYFGISAWGYFNEANSLAGDPYNLIYNGGISGDTTRAFLAGTGSWIGNQPGAQYGVGLAGALTSKARYVIIGGIVNDPTTYTAQQIFDNTVSGAEPGIGIKQAIDQIRSNGQIAVVTGEYGTGGSNSTQIALDTSYNEIVREYCANGNCIYLDFPSVLWTSAATSSALAFGTNYLQSDTTHPAVPGGYALGVYFNTIFSKLVGPSPSFASPTLVDSNLPNTTFTTQSGGTKSGSGTLTAGTVPSGWTLTISTGVSVTITYPADPLGGNDIALAIVNTSGGANNALVTFTANANSGNASAGQQFQAGGTVTIAAGATNYGGTSCYVGVWNGSGWGYLQTDMQNTVSNTVAYPAGPITQTLRSPIPWIGSTQATGSSTVQIAGFTPGIAYNIGFVGNGAATVTIARPWLRLVQSTVNGSVD